MPYHRRDQSGVALLDVEGKMDEGFMAEVERAISSGKPRVLVNLARSQFIRGDHMEWMVEAHHRCEKAGGGFGLAAVPGDFRYILSIMELDQFFRLFENDAAGIAALSAPAARPDSTEAPAVLDEIELGPATPRPGAVRRAPAAPAAPPGPTKPAGPLSPAEREKRVELFVRNVAKGMIFLKVFESLARGQHKKLDARALAEQLKERQNEVALVLQHLKGLSIVREVKPGDFRYAPGPKALEEITAFLRMWNNPGSHAKVYRWVFQEEEERKKATKSSSGLWGRLFGKE